MRRSGAITIEFLMAIMFSSVLIPIVYLSLRLLFQHNYFNQSAQDEIALYQLRKRLLLMENFVVRDTVLEASGYDETFHLTFKNNHLYLQPGTQIFLSDISEGYFSQKGTLIMFTYVRYNQTMSRVIASEK